MKGKRNDSYLINMEVISVLYQWWCDCQSAVTCPVWASVRAAVMSQRCHQSHQPIVVLLSAWLTPHARRRPAFGLFETATPRPPCGRSRGRTPHYISRMMIKTELYATYDITGPPVHTWRRRSHFLYLSSRERHVLKEKKRGNYNLYFAGFRLQ